MTRRPADEDRAGGRNTLTRFADEDMATPGADPNLDLIGLEIEYVGDGCTYTVEKTVAWSADYVRGSLTYTDGRVIENIVKPAAGVRRRLELDNA